LSNPSVTDSGLCGSSVTLHTDWFIDWLTDWLIRRLTDWQTGADIECWVKAVKMLRGNDGHRRRHSLAPTWGTRQHSGPYLVWFNQFSDNRDCVRTINSSLLPAGSIHTDTQWIIAGMVKPCKWAL